MRDNADVASRRLRTATYSAEARERLGKAVEQARERAGYTSRPQFIKAAGIKSLRSVELLEAGDPGVGQEILFKVARALPGWTEDTPRSILDGGEIPAIVESTPPSTRATIPGSNVDPMSSIGLPIGSDAWLRYYAERVPEEDFLEIRAAVLRLQRKLGEVQHLVAERDQPHVSR